MFSRIEDPYQPDFNVTIEYDSLDPSVKLFLVNHARSRDRYSHAGMDKVFKHILEKITPDIVHVNHLSHLSTGIINIAYSKRIPIVFTLHDYWLSCPRGQFIQMALGETHTYPECPTQENRQCAIHCMCRMWGGIELQDDEDYWTRWVQLRQNEMRKIICKVNVLISPSKYLRERIIKSLQIPPEKVLFEPYGFDLNRLKGRIRAKEDQFIFGYIGRIDPSKGIDLLIKAFGKTRGSAKLRIWGRFSATDTPALKQLAQALPNHRGEQIEWLPEYQNNRIITQVFNHVDCIVVPSIWAENSPLVIQEALQAKVPVITSEKGGMGELIRDGVNGFTFKHRSVEDLSKRLQYVMDNPKHTAKIAQRGYLLSKEGSIHRIEDHAQFLLKTFKKAIDENKL